MTMPTTVPVVQTVKLPDPGFPMLTRMISDPLFPEMKSQVMGCPHCKQSISIPVPGDKEEPITWIVGKPHPLVPNMNVMRMFVDRGGVEVYSVASDGKAGMRNLVPMDSVRLIEEAMPLDVFVEELTAAEDEDDDPEPGDPEPGDPGDPETPPSPIPAQANGQPAS